MHELNQRIKVRSIKFKRSFEGGFGIIESVCGAFTLELDKLSA